MRWYRKHMAVTCSWNADWKKNIQWHNQAIQVVTPDYIDQAYREISWISQYCRCVCHCLSRPIKIKINEAGAGGDFSALDVWAAARLFFLLGAMQNWTLGRWHSWTALERTGNSDFVEVGLCNCTVFLPDSTVLSESMSYNFRNFNAGKFSFNQRLYFPSPESKANFCLTLEHYSRCVIV